MSDGEIEVSVHHHIDERGLHSTEYEVHTGFDDEVIISEELARRVYAETGLDLWNDDYRSGGEVLIQSENDGNSASLGTGKDRSGGDGS